MTDTITWEDSFAIAKTLRSHHPEVNLEDVSLEMIYEWTLQLPGFEDDPELANDSLLTLIYQEWLESLITFE